MGAVSEGCKWDVHGDLSPAPIGLPFAEEEVW
jgi:hypothetical protein